MGGSIRVVFDGGTEKIISTDSLSDAEQAVEEFKKSGRLGRIVVKGNYGRKTVIDLSQVRMIEIL